MSETAVLTESSHQKLIGDLKKLIAEARTRASQAVSRENVRLYWEVGRRIEQEHLTLNAGYRNTVYLDLAKKLDLDVSTLKQSVIFFRSYKSSSPRGTTLTWAHFRELATLKSLEERSWYQKMADEEKWTRDRLVQAMKRDAFLESKKTKGKSKNGSLKRPAEPKYIYKTWVERVIDGDTLLLRIDLGFQVQKEQRVRLAAIDCPEIDTAGGRKAFYFVQNQLAKVSSVVIQTNKIDIYGRYVAHVFYSLTETAIGKIFKEGRYLNQELLDRGLAKRM